MARVLEPYEVEIGCGLIANVSSCCGGPGVDLSVPADTPEERGQRLAAFDMARETLNLLTAGLVANCPVVARPCSVACCLTSDLWLQAGMMWFPKNLGGGVWVNACGCEDPCECTRRNGLDLGFPVAEVLSVSIDGADLPESDFRLAGNRWLYRLGLDKTWPTRQDMDAFPDEVGSFAVTMRPGYELGAAGERALGRLVCEYLKSMCGQKCALPKNITSITRAGVSMEINAGLFNDGLLGIREVDLFIESLNPNHLKFVPTVTSPDLRRAGV